MRFMLAARAAVSTTALIAIIGLGLPRTAMADAPLLSTEQFFAGDAARVPAVEEQDRARIAPGGPGYLVVWEDQRAILSGFPYTAYEFMTGNQIDIYGMRLDPQGNPLDEGPIAICQAGRNQTKPEVAWNEAAQQWLVVFTSEKNDWYFFEDIVAVRVAADGTVLDPTPILLRPENNSPANDQAMSPSVASDGTQWLAVWQDILWQGGIGYPNLAGKRIAADGTVIDASPVVLFQHNSYSFGPIAPHLAWATDEWFLVWEHAGYNDIHGRRFDATLAPLDATPLTITTFGTHPRVATNGTDFMVVHRSNMAHRVTHEGLVLDPAGIPFQSPGGNDVRGPDVTWDGSQWVTVNTGLTAGVPRVYVNRITTAGVVLPPGGIVLQPSTGDQYKPSAASDGNGTVQICWSGRNIPAQVIENVQATQLRPDLSVGPLVEASAGLRRQTDVRFVTNGNLHLAVFTSRGGGTTQLLAQRIDSAGIPIDPEPIEVVAIPEGYALNGDVAWNGTHYLFAWAFDGSLYGRRLDANLAPVDPAPVFFAADAAGPPGVGSVGGDFFLAYSHTFSVDQRELHGFLVDGATMSLLTGPSAIGGGYVVWFPRVKALGSRYFVVWQGQANHDISQSTTRGLLVNSDGSLFGSQFAINSASADAREPDLAVAGDRALVSYADVDQGDFGRISGRIVNADGTFRTPEFVIADAPSAQRFTAAGYDGERFVTAWVDFRTISGVEQFRGDIWAARVTLEGAVEDAPGGFQLTSGELPEDLPQVTGVDGKMVVAYSRLEGPVSPEVQRLGLRTVGLAVASVPVASVGGTAWLIGPNPFTESLDIELAGAADGRGATAIEIYSAAGRLVARKALAPPQTSWRWNGRLDSGERAGSGVYFLRLMEDGVARQTRSIVKLR